MATSSVACSATAAASSISDEEFDLLRWAVTAARNKPIHRLASLRLMMQEAFPGREDAIQRALLFWASHVQKQGLEAAHAGQE